MPLEPTVTVRLYRWQDCGSWEFDYPPESEPYEMPESLKRRYEAAHTEYHAAAEAIQEWKDEQDVKRDDQT